MKYNPGFAIEPVENPLGFRYGEDVFGPEVEQRRLEAIRPSLLDPNVSGPEIVYGISMDVGRKEDRQKIEQHHLLYGAVTYAKGLLGKEPVRSQGHIHAVSPSCGMSTCEVYEIWTGAAYIYMQEYGEDDPGRCYAIYGEAGDVIIVPPGWVHATLSADPTQQLAFGAWCVRDYGFVYEQVRRHHGIAWFLTFENGQKKFIANPRYRTSQLIVRRPRSYTEFHIRKGQPIYRQFLEDEHRFGFVSRPDLYMDLWKNFEP